jgi:hypothetical protein
MPDPTSSHRRLCSGGHLGQHATCLPERSADVPCVGRFAAVSTGVFGGLPGRLRYRALSRDADPTACRHRTGAHHPWPYQPVPHRSREKHLAWHLPAPRKTATTSSTRDTRGRFRDAGAHDRNAGTPRSGNHTSRLRWCVSSFGVGRASVRRCRIRQRGSTSDAQEIENRSGRRGSQSCHSICTVTRLPSKGANQLARQRWDSIRPTLPHC